MLTTIIIILVAFFIIRWATNRKKIKERPSWSIGYALYYLTDIFTYEYDKDEALGRVVMASRDGMPNLENFSNQRIIVGLKSYANAQGEISKINSATVIQSLSEALAVEARTTLQIATSRLYISDFIKGFEPDISEKDLENATEELSKSIQQKPLSDAGKQAIHQLVESYLMSSFERYHKKDFFSFAADAAQGLVGEAG